MGEERSDWSIPMRSWGVLSAERESWLAIDPKGLIVLFANYPDNSCKKIEIEES